jgi:hypothetical protein
MRFSSLTMSKPMKYKKVGQNFVIFQQRNWEILELF